MRKLLKTLRMSKEQVGEEQINFRFASIHVMSKRVEELKIENLGKSFNFQVTVETKVQPAGKLVIPFIYVKIMFVDNTDSIADFTIACAFYIEEFEKIILPNEEGVYTVPQDFDNLIRPISISTARGVIASDLRGTYLQNAIMPVIFMDQLKPVSKDDLDKLK